jgi:hypothetical protein
MIEKIKSEILEAMLSAARASQDVTDIMKIRGERKALTE